MMTVLSWVNSCLLYTSDVYKRQLMYKAFVRAKSGCDKWHDYEMSVAPYETDKPIYYEFTACPAAEFAIKHGLTDIMPALCNVDFASMELLHARLIRTNTCVNGCRCDYTCLLYTSRCV